jgi:hypothetical protein
MASKIAPYKVIFEFDNSSEHAIITINYNSFDRLQQFNLQLGRIYDFYMLYCEADAIQKTHLANIEREGYDPNIIKIKYEEQIYKAICFGIIQKIASTHPDFLMDIARKLKSDNQDIGYLIETLNDPSQKRKNSDRLESIMETFAEDLAECVPKPLYP